MGSQRRCEKGLITMDTDIEYLFNDADRRIERLESID